MKQTSLFETQIELDLIDINKASELLGVSTATIRNWVKTGQISYTNQTGRKSKFLDRQHVEKLREDIQKGKTSRLNNRANKRSSTLTFIPIEQLGDRNLLPVLQSYIEIINRNKLSIQQALLIHSLSVLKKAGLVTYENPLTSLEGVSFKNENIKKVVLEWSKTLHTLNLAKYQELTMVDTIFGYDSLGILYQSLQDEGKKSRGGSYYTHRVVIEEIVEELSSQITSNTKVLDPCCGTAQFLMLFSKYILNPQLLWGYDIDPIAVQIAKINLLVSYPQFDFYPNIYLANTLTENPDGFFDIVATNPPWGFHFSKDESEKLKILYPSILSNEAFSYFLLRGIQLLNKDGSLCYVLPEAITKIKQHRDIREFILKNTTIKSIKHLGNVFSKVLSPVITLNIQNTKSTENRIDVIQRDGNRSQPKQGRFENNLDFTFDTSITEEDEKIIEKIFKNGFTTLKGNADWALGIVTGNNKEFISDTKTSDNEGILKGSDIDKYSFKAASSFITFLPDDFQQVAPVEKYRAKEKLIYKFISKELSFAYDNKQTLTLNSANILIPRVPNIPVKVVLAFLNSEVFQFVFKKKFNTVKILRGDLENLPFPSLTPELTRDIEELVNNLIAGKKKDINQDKLNNLIYSTYKLTEEEKRYINNFIKG